MSTVTLFGVVAVTFMMLMYALEARARGFVLAFAAGCLLSSATASSLELGPSGSSRPSGHWSRCAATWLWEQTAVREAAHPCGTRLRDMVARIAWPADTLVLSVRRGGATLFAKPQTTVERGDEPVVMTRPEHMDAPGSMLAADRPRRLAGRGPSDVTDDAHSRCGSHPVGCPPRNGEPYFFRGGASRYAGTEAPWLGAVSIRLQARECAKPWSRVTIPRGEYVLLRHRLGSAWPACRHTRVVDLATSAVGSRVQHMDLARRGLPLRPLDHHGLRPRSL